MKLDTVFFGDGKNIKPSSIKFDQLLNKVFPEIEADFKKAGLPNAAGLAIKDSDARKLLATETSTPRAKDPYLQVGVWKKDLVMAVFDKSNPKFDAYEVIVKGYLDVKEALAKKHTEVVNLAVGDKIIDGAAKAQADKFGTSVKSEADMDLGDLTGDLVLCAHGTPKVLPGRVIGTKLGGKTADDIVAMLTADKDKSKRIGKDYRGTITLSGCFTASGGPEADRQDDVFAKKVLDALVKKGYKKVTVVGMPGPSWTARDPGDKDSHGTPLARGEKAVWHSGRSEEGLEAQELKAKKLRKDIDSLVDALVAGAKKSKLDGPAYLMSDQARPVLAKLKQLEGALHSVREEIDTIVKEQKRTGDVDGADVAHMKGTFGFKALQDALKLR